MADQLPDQGASQSGVDLIAAERERQIAQEGWTSEHDTRAVIYGIGTHNALAVMSPMGSVIVCANGYCHVCGDSLVRPDNARQVLFCCRCQEERVYGSS